jgi:dihydrofolate synthase/folylpolyglutamate synthase
MELLLEDPFLLVDGAHNGSGVAALAGSLRMLYPGEKFHFIMGVMADKDYETMIEELLPLALSFVTYTPDSSRALQGSRLAECIRRRGVCAEEKTQLAEIAEALKPDAKNIAFGSLYFIGDIKKYFQRCRKL